MYPCRQANTVIMSDGVAVPAVGCLPTARPLSEGRLEVIVLTVWDAFLRSQQHDRGAVAKEGSEGWMLHPVLPRIEYYIDFICAMCPLQLCVFCSLLNMCLMQVCVRRQVHTMRINTTSTHAHTRVYARTYAWES